MKNLIYVALLLLAGLLIFKLCGKLGIVDCPPCSSSITCADAQFSQDSFPQTGFDYMPGSDSFEIWVNTPYSGHRMRKHAWNIWAGLNQPAKNGTDQVIWQTWKTATQAYQDKELGQSRPMMQKLKRLVDYPKQDPSIERTPPRYLISECLQERYGIDSVSQVNVDGCHYQFNGDVLIAGVAYNKSAFEWIRNKDQPLYLKATLLDSLKKSINRGVKNPGVGPFPNTSIVIKPMLWPVKGTGHTPLPVWDNLSPELTEGNMKYPGFENKKFWKRAVAITPGEVQTTPLDSIRFMYNVLNRDNSDSLKNIYTNVEVVGLDNFYSWEIDSTQLANMSCSDRLILDLSASWCYGRPFEAGDHLALVAMHMFTKEFPDWTMQTAWWHDHPDTSRFASHRPSNLLDTLDTPWKKYLMVSTYGQPQQAAKAKGENKHVFIPPGGDSTATYWPVAYNPYIELGGLHPIATNCRNCHLRAGWTLENTATNYLASGGPSSTLVIDTANNLLFDNVIRADFQWAIPDRVLPNPNVK